MTSNPSQVSMIVLPPEMRGPQIARESIAGDFDMTEQALRNKKLLKKLKIHTPKKLLKKAKEGVDLSFEEAFCAMCHVLAVTNAWFAREYEKHTGNVANTADTIQLLMAIGDKKTKHSLTAEEVAGLAAAVKLDMVFELNVPSAMDTCGTGSDRGFVKDGVKYATINDSTLSAFVLASLGVPTVKHGAPGRNSTIGSSDFIEQIGACIIGSNSVDFHQVMKKSGFCYIDARVCSTFSDIVLGLLKINAINDIVGPMCSPVSLETVLNRVCGTHHMVHPTVLAQAHTLLHAYGFQNGGGFISVCGLNENASSLDSPDDRDGVAQYAMLDSLSPFQSVVALAYRGHYRGCFFVSPADFGVSIVPEDCFVPNTQEDILRANIQAITGGNDALSTFLAMNAALGLLVDQFAGSATTVVYDGLNKKLLTRLYGICRQAINNGSAIAKLREFVTATGGSPTV